MPFARPPRPEFQARCERRGGTAVVIVRGELDMESAETLRVLLSSPEAQAETVILDLREVSFMDSSGLSVVVSEYQRAKAQQFRFAVAAGGARQVQRLFELCGLTGTIAMVEDPDALCSA